MLLRIALFELRYQIRQPLFWIASTLFFLFTFGAVTTDAIMLGGSIGSINRNAPFVIFQMLAVMTVIGTFLTTAFVSNSVHRDFESQTDALFFSLPLKKRDYLFGRFGGSLLVANLVFLGVILGIVIGSFMPWLEPERVGAFHLAPYLQGVLIFVLPNLFLTGAIFFSIATLTRSLMYTYAGVVTFMTGWGIAQVWLNDLDNRTIGALLDPYGFGAFDLYSRYWTVAERNTNGLPLTGVLLWNRVIWVGAAVLILAFTYFRFRLSIAAPGVVRRKRLLEQVAAEGAMDRPAVAVRTAPVTQTFGPATSRMQYFHQARIETVGVLKGVAFLIMLFAGALNIVGSSTVIDEMFGTAVLPVTHLMLRVIDGSFNLFVFLILIFYSGELIWRERTLRMSDMVDALPVPTWVMWASKLTALCATVFVLLGAAMATSIGVQLYRGYTHFEIPLYMKSLLFMEAPFFLILASLCVFVQVITNNKFLGWLVSTVVYVAGQVMPAMRLEHHLYRFGTGPAAPYSDMNGYGHFVQPRIWFTIYWGAFAAALVVLAHLLWVRGSESRFGLRLREARRRMSAPVTAALAACAVVVIGAGGVIYYNTNILNTYMPVKVQQDRQAEFEKKYKQYERQNGARVIDVQADVDLHPESRSADIRGRYILKNKTAVPVETVHLWLNPLNTIRALTVQGGRLEMEDADLGYRIYRLATPLAPGAETQVTFDIARTNHGFVNENSNTDLVANGTFISSQDYFPHIGYSNGNELQDPNERRKRGLPPVQRFPKIDDAAARNSNYLSSEADWIHYETNVSTSPDQIALAPGYLQREWEEGGRRHFHYAMDAPIFDYFAYLSARYAVKRDKWNDVAIEIYYHPDHPYNVDRMINGVKKSLDYFTREFGPYQHRQVRILEFPRYARFAESFPNTIPFSESIGFIARIDDAKPDSIDYVFYVTAHEVAHQWWAHQVMGGNVQGATLMSETMAQYSALMVMEKEYGRDKMRRFLKFELDNYLQARGGERIEELPLYLVENQPYIHYRKGSLVMYALRD